MDKGPGPRPLGWGLWVEDANYWMNIIPKGRIKAKSLHIVCFTISSSNSVKIGQPKISFMTVKTHTYIRVSKGPKIS